MTEAEIRLGLAAVQRILGSANTQVTQLHTRAAVVSSRVEELCETPTEVFARCLERIRASRAEIRKTHRRFIESLETSNAEMRRFKDEVTNLAESTAHAIDSRRVLINVSAELSVLTQQQFQVLASGVAEAVTTNETVAREKTDDLCEALDDFAENWSGVTEDLQGEVESKLEEVCELIVETLSDRVTNEIVEGLGGVLESMETAASTVDDLATTLQSALQGVSDAMSGVESTIGAAKPALQVMSAVT